MSRGSRSTDARLTPQQEAARRLGFVRDAAGECFELLGIESPPYFSEVTGHPDDALRCMAIGMRNVDPEVLRDHPNVLVGSVAYIVERLQAARAGLGVNYVTIPQEKNG
jgi:hypothetical protein